MRRGKRTRASSARRAAGPRASAKLTTDHEDIQRWAEERGGCPARVQRPGKDRQGGGILRIDFPDFKRSRSLKSISWSEWFDVFEERRLGFLHQDRTAGGKVSRFNKIVCRE